MTFLYEYMNSDELAIARESAKVENESLKLEHAFNIAEMRHEIRMSDIEVNSLVNEYTEDDLTAMYIREMEIYMEETQSLWQKFKAFIKGIINKIFGRVKETKDLPLEDPEGTIEFPFNPSAAKKFLSEARNAIKQFLVPKNSEGDVDKSEQAKNITILGVALASATAAGVALETKVLKPIKMKRKEARQAFEEISKETQEFLNESLADGDKIAEKNGGALSTVMSIIKAPVNKLQEKLNAVKAKLFGGKSDENKDENNGDNNEGNNGGNEPDGGEPENAEGGEDKKEEKLSEVLSKTGSGERLDALRNYANSYRKDLGIDPKIRTKDIVIDFGMLAKIRNHMKKNLPDRSQKWGKLMMYIQQNKGNIKFNEATRFDPILGIDVAYEYDYHSMDDSTEYVGESLLNIEDFMNPSPRGDMTELLKLVDNL